MKPLKIYLYFIYIIQNMYYYIKYFTRDIIGYQIRDSFKKKYMGSGFQNQNKCLK